MNTEIRKAKGREVMKMYETVKIVNGYEIVRMKGTHGAYHITVRKGNGWKAFLTFSTIKAASAWAAAN